MHAYNITRTLSFARKTEWYWYVIISFQSEAYPSIWTPIYRYVLWPDEHNL